ncbi:phospholipase A [Alistipes indistinctus]|uniref:phospholipase A n=1 Tax=Alistipes indistinctus TaxID=626932 RepID=UPI00266F2EC0|nr:phospholipase A [Alistipes indistinctus]
MPYNTYLFLTYTQKSFWEIYRKSKPFSDNNYNPTLGLGNLLRKNGKAVGLVMLQYEHESNGRDSIWSRSWNRISLLGQIFFSRNWSMEVKLWAPFSLDDPNRDIVYYNGYGLVAANYKSDNERLWLSACITKRGGWNLNANTELEVAWRAIRKCNLYLTLQYYNGYGEGLLAYNQFHNYLRIGFVIKPRHVSIF